MKLGYLAVNQYGEKVSLPRADQSPRKQLAQQLGTSKLEKMYIDKKNGSTAHVGYVAGDEWWTLFEVHAWEGKGKND